MYRDISDQSAQQKQFRATYTYKNPFNDFDVSTCLSTSPILEIHDSHPPSKNPTPFTLIATARIASDTPPTGNPHTVQTPQIALALTPDPGSNHPLSKSANTPPSPPTPTEPSAAASTLYNGPKSALAGTLRPFLRTELNFVVTNYQSGDVRHLPTLRDFFCERCHPPTRNSYCNQNTVSSSIIAMFCQKCEETLVKPLTLLAKGGSLYLFSKPHHTTPRGLLDAAQSGCGLCQGIVDSLRVYKFLLDPHTTYNGGFLIVGCERNLDRYRWFEIKIDSAPTVPKFRITLWGFPVTGPLELRPVQGRGGRVEGLQFENPSTPLLEQYGMKNLSCYDTGDEKVIDRGRWWIEKCLGEHKLCKDDWVPDYVPPRLLDLNNKLPVLIDTRKLDAGVCYAALSYCWGIEPSHLRLTSENANKLSQGIPFGELPKTFIDAIKVSKQLGINYLWIDSLCILQAGVGSFEDWQTHVSKMAVIYSNCVLNIAADHGADANCGLFSSRNPHHIGPNLIKPPLHPITPSRTKAPKDRIDERTVDYSDTFVILSHEFWRANVIESVLMGRAWVYQERFLAPRTLHFGKNQLFWECNELERACEAFPNGMSQLVHRHWYNQFPNSWRNFGDKDTYERQWCRIVENFSKGNLSHMADKLPAIAGIASRVFMIYQDEYIVGFFKKQLPRALYWYPRRGRAIKPPYRAPSWSWASVQGEVDFELPGNFEPALSLATIEKLEVQLVDKENPFGQIVSASITLRAQLFRPLGRSQQNNHDDVLVEYVHNKSSGSARKTKEVIIELKFDDSSVAQPPQQQLFYLCLHGSRLQMRVGLILVSHSDEPDCYIRVGSFVVSTWGIEKEHPYSIVKIL
ncbi:hypothetical protein G7Y89_g7834 [Cudoniella acicularis]|uniref:Heterokaryon incompatibility domain-containing protein n=1 Tax=Cudoniella acicularis TaxID=354080 RepID=A0A8H4RK77_9HELO|nr:hypothetical protein G7Y89_g7834 [Cudoniella acicularis]